MTVPTPNAQEEQRRDDVDLAPARRGIAAQSAAYDRALILGSLMWLTSALNHSANDAVMVPDRQRLREDGQRALDNSGAKRVMR